MLAEEDYGMTRVSSYCLEEVEKDDYFETNKLFEGAAGLQVAF